MKLLRFILASIYSVGVFVGLGLAIAKISSGAYISLGVAFTAYIIMVSSHFIKKEV